MIRRERWGYGRFFFSAMENWVTYSILSEASRRLEDPCRGGLREGWRGLEREDDLQFRPSVFLIQPPSGRQGQPRKQKPADWQAGRAADGEIKGRQREREKAFPLLKGCIKATNTETIPRETKRTTSRVSGVEAWQTLWCLFRCISTNTQSELVFLRAWRDGWLEKDKQWLICRNLQFLY